MISKIFKIILFLVLSYQTPVYSKSTSFNDFNSRDLSNYFSGIIAYENRDNSEALKYFNLSKVLLNSHDNYLKRYVNSLVLENKVAQAINVVKNNSKKSNSDFFDAYVLLIIDSLKKNDFDKADIYLDQSLRFQEENRINLVIFETLKQYIYTFKNKKLLPNKKNFGNLSLIAEAFQRCYYNDQRTSSFFLNLINSQQGDYSRYIFFYINYLIQNNEFDQAKSVIDQIDYIGSTLLLTQTKSWIDNNKFKSFEKIFSCKNHNDIISEFLFLISNLYSSQDNFEKSNFYLNLSIYLNPKFEFNLSLVAENFFADGEYNKVKKIVRKFKETDEFYYWFRVKKEAQIIVKEQNYEKGTSYIESKFKNIKKPNPKIIFDLANFYKNSKNYELAIDYYTKLISSLEDASVIKSDILYRRGGSYERLGNYEKSDEDLLHALRIRPDDAYVLNYLAYSWLERDYKIDEAMEMLKIAYNSKSNDPYIIDSIGWAYFLIDEYKEAEKYLKRAVELMPDDPIVNDHFADCLWMNDNKIQARYYWNNALEFDADDKLKKKIKRKILFGLEDI